ncbi:MAG TPA: hypothetical protein VF165_17050 [Nocardioidaceae bacterium]
MTLGGFGGLRDGGGEAKPASPPHRSARLYTNTTRTELTGK